MEKIKCGYKKCTKDADIVYNGKHYCMDCWHVWAIQQKKVCLDWEVVNCDS